MMEDPDCKVCQLIKADFGDDNSCWTHSEQDWRAAARMLAMRSSPTKVE